MQSELKELEHEKLVLVDEIEKITIQLRDFNRIDSETGERINGHDYHEWRTRAETARQFKQARLREIKLQIREIEVDSSNETLSRMEKKLDEIIVLLTEEVDE